jgi:squalene synthase HpnC
MGWNAWQAPTSRDAAAWTLVQETDVHTSEIASAARRSGGPPALQQAVPPALREAELFCRKIAKGHYENFSVISWLVPRSLRQDFANVYAFARWSDDLADESESPQAAGRALDSWRRQLEACGRGEAHHPILVALADTLRRHQLSPSPFHDLLDAFTQDQRVVRYETRAELLDYCRRSANPVGRIVLALGGCHDPQRQAESDAICSGLQLVNFWQDIRRDRCAGRVYLPIEDMHRHRVCEADLDAPQAGPALRNLVADEVAWAESFFTAGEPLLRRAPPLLRPAIAAFVGGGRAVAAAIRREGYDTLTRRPVVSKAKKFFLAARAVTGRLTSGFAGPDRTAAEAGQT